jgi:hypothetical protein|nr:hypothetical protein [uncultured Halomonas sp.]
MESIYEEFPEEEKRKVFGNELPEELRESKKEIKSFNVSQDIDVEKFVKPLPKKKKEFDGPSMS